MHARVCRHSGAHAPSATSLGRTTRSNATLAAAVGGAGGDGGAGGGDGTSQSSVISQACAGARVRARNPVSANASIGGTGSG